MNKQQFLQELDRRLKLIPADDRQDAIEYYDGYISDMELPEGADVVASLGTPKEVAKNIIEQCTQKHIENTAEQKTVKGKATVVWLTILGVLALPLSLPLGIMVMAIVFAVLITIVAVVFALIVSAVAIAASGFFSIFWGLFVPGFAQKLFTIGAGLMISGLSILLVYGLVLLIRTVSHNIYRKKETEGTGYEQ
jgi:uncharacterized membrane protein